MIVVVVVEEGHGQSHWPWFRHRHDDHDWDQRSPGGPTHGIPPDVAASLAPKALAKSLAPLLQGAAANGSDVPVGSPKAVVWVDGSNEVLAHLDSLSIRVLAGAVVVSIDLESDQTGRAPVVVRFALAGASDTAGLIAATDEIAGGHPVLAARWGGAVQNAAWAALLALASQHATALGQAPAGVSAVPGSLRLHLAAPVDLATATRS
jgi:hypothetical protein